MSKFLSRKNETKKISIFFINLFQKVMLKKLFRLTFQLQRNLKLMKINLIWSEVVGTSIFAFSILLIFFILCGSSSRCSTWCSIPPIDRLNLKLSIYLWLFSVIVFGAYTNDAFWIRIIDTSVSVIFVHFSSTGIQWYFTVVLSSVFKLLANAQNEVNKSKSFKIEVWIQMCWCPQNISILHCNSKGSHNSVGKNNQ